MGSRKYKLVKGVIASALAGAVIANFSGCGIKDNVPDIISSNKTDSINLYDDEQNRLCVITFIDKNNVVQEEKYGYFYNKNNNIIFKDALENKEISLEQVKKNNYKVYYIDYLDLLSFYELKMVEEYECVSKNYLKYEEDKFHPYYDNIRRNMPRFMIENRQMNEFNASAYFKK